MTNPVLHSFELDEGAIPIYVCEFLSYMDADGTVQTVYRVGGDVAVKELVGTLEILQQMWVHSALSQE